MRFLHALITCIVVSTVLMLAGLLPAADSGKPADRESLTKLRAARKTVAERSRRVIYNNDGDETIYQCREVSVEELLKHRTAPLAGSHVDTIFYCSGAGFGLFTHQTKLGSNFVSREGRFSTNLTDKYLAAGIDPLKEMIAFGHRNKMEVFCSFRVNDTHDASEHDYGPIMFRANPLKNNHPEWLIGAIKQKPKFGGWAAVDYGQADVRDMVFKFVEEVCQNFDVDGIELDFFRHPVFFKRAAQAGVVCNDEERQQMTETIGRIRAMTETEGLRRGRPLLVAIRVPDSASYCHDIGLDVDRWMDDGLFDMLSGASYFQLNGWETSVAWTKRGHVPFYPSLDESRVQDPTAQALRMTPEAYRGRALAAWRAGVAGIYMFNSFDPTKAMWRELGDPKVLDKLDQDYFASIRGVGYAAGGALPHREYQKIPTLNPKNPLVATATQPTSVTFPFASESAAKRTDNSASVTLRLQFEGLKNPSDVRVKLNDLALDAPRAADGWLEFRLPPGQPRLGTNRVEVVPADGKDKLTWTDLHCTVRWPASKSP